MIREIAELGGASVEVLQDWLLERGLDLPPWWGQTGPGTGSGTGSGRGSGRGSGYGTGTGSGDGLGTGHGHGDGSGYGSGSGYGLGYGSTRFMDCVLDVRERRAGG